MSQSRDAAALASIEELSRELAAAILKDRAPAIAIPTRTKSNTLWNTTERILQMGDATSTRELFNVSQAKQFLQTFIQMEGVKQLIEEDKTLSLRGMYYRALHTIKGTKEKTFNGQEESDAILEDLEVLLGALREDLHIYAKKRGTMVGNITLTDSGDEIDCRRMGSGGYAVPSITEGHVLKFKKCEAKFVLHVEKDTVWGRFNEDRFWEKHNCILTEGSGQPPRGVRRLLRRLNEELGLPIICLLDCDPWGHYIYSVIKQGSIGLAYESERLAVPSAKFLGIRSKDFDVCELSEDVKIDLTKTDTDRAEQILKYPWFSGHDGWSQEINKMLRNGFKMEVESLITKDISYVTEKYVPARLKAEDWLE